MVNKCKSSQYDAGAFFSEEAKKYALLTRDQEKNYGKQLFRYKQEIISQLSELPRYEGCLEERLEQARDGEVADRAYAIIKPDKTDEPTRIRLYACLEKTQKINDYLKNAKSKYHISVKKQEKSSLLNKFRYTRKFINDLVNELKQQYESRKLMKYSAEIKIVFSLREEYEKIFEKFFNANLRLVRSIANKYRYRKGMEFSDLLNEGCTGLMTAVDKFDYRRGCKFSTFATHWVKQAITRALQEKSYAIRLPTYVVEDLMKIKNAKKEALRTGKTLTTEEISSATGISENEIERLKKVYAKHIVSLDKLTTTEEGEGKPFVESIIDAKAEDPCWGAIHKNLKDKIFELLANLKPRERTAIVLRHGLDGRNPRTLEQVGKILKVTRERARQIQMKAMRRLQYPARSKKLRGFLDKTSFYEARQMFSAKDF